jgi:hypothetical protein
MNLIRQPTQLMAQVDEVGQSQAKQIALRCPRLLFRAHPKTPRYPRINAIILQYQTTTIINNAL